MAKRALWVFAFVAPLVIILFAVWHRQDPLLQPNQRLHVTSLNRDTVDDELVQGMGVSRDITAQAFTDATNILVQERRMWSHLNEMSAGIDIVFDGSDAKHLSLKGTVRLRRLELSSAEKKGGIIAKHEMILSNKRDGWTVKADDMFFKNAPSKHTVISSQHPETVEIIKTIGPESILHMLTFPEYFLGWVHSVELYPKRGLTPDQALNVWKPWVVTNAVPHSYTFWYAQEYQKLQQVLGKGGTSHYRNVFPDFTFMNGHLYRVRRMELTMPGSVLKETMIISFENYVESNGFKYPTLFRITPAPTPWPYPQMVWGLFVPEGHLALSGQLRITLSDVSLNVK